MNRTTTMKASVLAFAASLVFVVSSCDRQDRDADARDTAPAVNYADEAAAQRLPVEPAPPPSDIDPDSLPADVDPEVHDLALGKRIYTNHCFACHGGGVAGAPRLGDTTDWAPRIAQGMDTLVQHSTEGFRGARGYMPPRGGFMALTDEQITAAVAYMVAESLP